MSAFEAYNLVPMTDRDEARQYDNGKSRRLLATVLSSETALINHDNWLDGTQRNQSFETRDKILALGFDCDSSFPLLLGSILQISVCLLY